ncbi:MAG: AMP-binding protein [Alphaproteobacteria bacterium]|nr:AMP-binding protein [Alphaproteobacteria bacterium]
MDLSRWIIRHADFTPDKTALRFEGKEISYAEFAAMIEALAAAMANKLDVSRGDRVAVLSLNSPVTLALLFACARLGAMISPLNWRLAGPEHNRMIADARPKALFVGEEFIDNVDGSRDEIDVPHFVAMNGEKENWISLDNLIEEYKGVTAPVSGGPEDALLLCYTSGSTGAPKGVVLTQNAMQFNAINSIHMHGLVGSDVALTTLPLFHVGGLNIQTLPALHLGATTILQKQFEPDATFDDLESGDVTLTCFVPAQMQAMVAHPRWAKASFEGIRSVTTGSTFVPHSLIEQFHKKSVPVIQIYGSTETAPIAVYTTVNDAHSKLGSTGKAAIHCEVRLVDDDGMDVGQGTSGEILVRGASVMREYWQQPDVTREVLDADGWFQTGDMGHFDEEGYLYVDDRKKDMIISGGENIYPAELENILAEVDDLAEAAVVGKSDARWGEVAVAVCVLKDGRTLKEQDVLAAFEDNLARYKHPKEVVFTDQLPRNAMGKVVKDDVRKLVSEITNDPEESLEAMKI